MPVPTPRTTNVATADAPAGRCDDCSAEVLQIRGVMAGHLHLPSDGSSAAIALDLRTGQNSRLL